MDWRGVQTTSHLPRGSAPTLGGGTTIPLKSQFFLLALRAENFVRKNCPKSAQKPFLDQFFAAKILAPEFCHNRPPGLCRCCPPPLIQRGSLAHLPLLLLLETCPGPAPSRPPLSSSTLAVAALSTGCLYSCGAAFPKGEVGHSRPDLPAQHRMGDRGRGWWTRDCNCISQTVTLQQFYFTFTY